MKRVTGFTLMELMVSVAIVAILAVIALPSFNEQARRGRRSEAISALGQWQLALEKYRADCPSYALVGACTTAYPPIPTSSNYTFSFAVAATATSFTLRAAPTADSPQDSDRCGNLDLAYAAGVTTKSPATQGCFQ